MSGICGLVHFDGSPVLPDTVGSLAAAAPHRSRNGTFEWTGSTIQLAHQANLLTPESATDQPLVGKDGRHVLVGAVRLDGRADLIRKLGGATRLTSDAALVMAAFEKWGDGAFEHLLGDFAIAIVDTVGHTVLLARDPFGLRPLYYRFEPGKRLVFGSEIAQVLAAPGVPVAPFEPAVAAHLAGPYGRPDWSFYEGVEQVAPGFKLLVSASGPPRIDRFWDVEPEPRIRYRDEREYADHFRAIFLDAVRDRMRVAGPLGIQLSGGMDSGSTASAAGHLGRSAESGPAIRTYSWAFRELTDCDERSVSDHIVRYYGLAGVPVDADDLWPLAGYPRHGPVRDDPFVLVYTAAGDAVRRRAAADGVRLMLVPERGDEVIGTQWVVDYLRLLRARRFGELAAELRLHAALTDDRWPAIVGRHLLRPTAGWLKGMVGGGRRDDAVDVPRWIRADFTARAGLPETMAERAHLLGAAPGAGATRYRAVFSLTGQRWATDLERRHARAGLGYSDPFADRRVVEYVLAIPQAVVNRPRDGSKRLLRAAMEGVMPGTALAGAHKLIPEGLFARGFYERGRATLLGLTESMRAAEFGYVDEQQAGSTIESWTADGPPPSLDPWWLITLEWWLRSHW